MLDINDVPEWMSAAEWCARRGLTGEPGCPLPNLMSATVAREINEYPEEFAEDVRLCAYAIAMGNKLDEWREA